MTDEEIMEKLRKFNTHWQWLTGRATAILGPRWADLTLFLWLLGTIVSIGDPKKKYTRYEKIGQGWVSNLMMDVQDAGPD